MDNVVTQLESLQDSIESAKWILGFFSFIVVALSLYITSSVKNLAEINSKLANLSKLTKIETTIKEAINNVDHNYWHKQQIEQVRRDKIELLMTEVQTHFDHCKWVYSELVAKKPIIELIPNKTIFILIFLYFKDLKSDYKQYDNAFDDFQIAYIRLLQLYSTKNQFINEKELATLMNTMTEKINIFIKASAKFTIEISEFSEGITSLDVKS